MKPIIKLAAVVAVLLASAGAQAAKPSAKAEKALDEYSAACYQDNDDLNRIFNDGEQGQIGANFQAACVMGVHDGYDHNTAQRAEMVQQLDDATKGPRESRSYGDMLSEVMNVKYLRSYDFGEALAKMDGK